MLKQLQCFKGTDFPRSVYYAKSKAVALGKISFMLTWRFLCLSRKTKTEGFSVSQSVTAWTSIYFGTANTLASSRLLWRTTVLSPVRLTVQMYLSFTRHFFETLPKTVIIYQVLVKRKHSVSVLRLIYSLEKKHALETWYISKNLTPPHFGLQKVHMVCHQVVVQQWNTHTHIHKI